MEHSRITPQSYRKRVEQFSREVESFDEGNFPIPNRTQQEVSQRVVDVEEDIAIQLLRDAVDTGYTVPCDYVRQVINDRNFTGRIYENNELNTWYSQACSGNVEDLTTPEDVLERRRATQIDLAKLILADEIVNHRLCGYSGSERASSLGFGIGTVTSLAAVIVDYHKRYIHALSI